jgi:hypothetical protein
VLLTAQALVNGAPHRPTPAWILASIGTQAALAHYGTSVDNIDMLLSMSAVNTLNLREASGSIPDTEGLLRVPVCDALAAALKHAAAAAKNLTDTEYFGLLPSMNSAALTWSHPGIPDVHLNLLV